MLFSSSRVFFCFARTLTRTLVFHLVGRSSNNSHAFQDPEMLAEKHGHEMHAELNKAWQDMHAHNNGNAATEGSPVDVHSTVNGTTAA